MKRHEHTDSLTARGRLALLLSNLLDLFHFDLQLRIRHLERRIEEIEVLKKSQISADLDFTAILLLLLCSFYTQAALRTR